jgi:hypothetical protein
LGSALQIWHREEGRQLIAEPVTLITDYLMAAVTGWLGWRLHQAREGHAARSYWACAFATSALAAGLGGSYHGFANLLDERFLQQLWTVTALIIGTGSFCMVAGSATAVTVGELRKVLLAFAAAQFAVYAVWTLTHDDFIYVIADTGTAMALVAALHGWSALRARDRASRWMLGGVGVSLLAAAVQASGIDLHRNFNHNDLYHVIQIAAMPLFYYGARGLRDRLN